MASIDWYGLAMADEPSAAEQAKALSAALRGQRDVGQLAMLTGDKMLGGFGQSLVGDAQKQEAQAAELAGTRLHRALQAQQMAQAEHRLNIQDAMLGLKSQEVGATSDAYGNPIIYNKHGNAGALSGPSGTSGPNTPGTAMRILGKGGGAGPGGALTPESLDQLATMFARTGAVPPVGRGKAAPMIVAQIVNRAAQMFPDADLAGNKAGYKADTTSLGKQQQLMDLTKSWEATGKANLGNLRRISGTLVNAGSPLANRPLRWLYQNAGGDPTVTAFKAAHAAVVNEYAKILSGNTGGGGVTEGARHEAESMLPLDSTPAQIAAAADVLETDAGNRLSALTAQLAETKNRTLGKPQPAKAEEAAAPAVRKFKRVNGKLVEDK